MVVPADPSWPEVFAAERVLIETALGAALVSGVHHVGSTSVPGMPAKPIIDMVAGVSDLSVAHGAAIALLQFGYHRHPHRVDAVAFTKGVGQRHTHHLHLTVPGSELWRERLAFRDALRADYALVQEYGELKARLLRETGGRPYRAEGKREFVRRVLDGVGVELAEGLHEDER